ncbi:MAG: tRNA (N(6)-L-threonylcarbamoyladenosine(37)-C(2))-methylthiotransferase MtaB [Nitrospiraceae bacterium]|nr:MAG: tRNA (N(6)-L-threonylcarbamoyladenosine(37)-C(2))-methylthiotransferase MtaB [Nitrospiraceae bacterium]
MKVTVKTLGCKVNQSESASIEGVLRINNYEVVNHSANPHIIIINTCSVTAKSDNQSRQLIRKAVKSGARVIVTGCYAQLNSDEISSMDGVDLIIGNSGKINILEYLKKIEKINGKPYTDVKPPTDLLKSQFYYSNRSRAFLKIQDGCNNSCSYCTVPLARGKSRSLSQEEVVDTTRKLVCDGYREVVLTGIHIGTYGFNLTPPSSLPDIVKRLVYGFPQLRIRLSSVEPQEVGTEILSLIGDGFICPHLHIPMQSGSNKILKAMNRGYTAEAYEQVINKIVTSYPEISIGTDLIVGFPGESDKDFNDTVNLVNILPLSYIHVFPYSRRPNTEASQMIDQVDDRVKKERIKYIIAISNMKKNIYRSRNIGRVLDVIVEQKASNNGYYKGISDNYLRVFLLSKAKLGRERLKARVISLTEDGIIAEPLD